MSIFHGILSSMLTKKDVKQMLSNAGSSSIFDICELDGAVSEKLVTKSKNTIFKKSIVRKDGGLVSLVRIDGVPSIVGNESYGDSIEFLDENLGGVLKKSGHRLTFYFTRDKDRVGRDVDDAMEVLINKNKVMGLSTDEFISEQRKLFSDRCCHESCYLALETLPTALLSNAAMKRSKKQTDNVIKEQGLLSPKYSGFGQNILGYIGDLVGVHASFINMVTSRIRDSNQNGGVRLSVMNARRAIYVMKSMIDPDRTSKNWNPTLIGDDYRPSFREKFDHLDTSHLAPPPLAEQIMNRDYTSDGNQDINSITRMGNMFYSVVHVDLPPAPFKSFSELFDTIPSTTPWRMSFAIETGSNTFSKKLANKRIAATFLAFSNSINEAIVDSIDTMRSEEQRNGANLVKANISFCTWGKTVDDVQTNASNISIAVESWGAQIKEETGDVPLGVLETIPCVTSKKVSKPSIVYLKDFLSSIPITRPTSVWDSGAFLGVTEDDKIWSYSSASDKQTSWIELLSAKSGSGKSLTLNALNLSLFSSVPSGKLPRLAIIDIGISSRLYIDYLKAIFPTQFSKHFKSYKLKMTSDYQVNIFDTPLGCRKPVSMDRGVIVNFLVTLLNDAGSTVIRKGLLELVSLMIDQMYADCVNDPAYYVKGMDPSLDNAIEVAQLNSSHKLPSVKTTFWDVTDFLALSGDIENAIKAQRSAVPNLSRASSTLGRENITELYSDEEGMALIAEVKRALSTSLSLYPNLCGVTNFDISSEDKIVSLDLSEVAGGTSESAVKQTNIMYMMARYLLAKDYYKDSDTLAEIKSQHSQQRGAHRNDEANSLYLEYHRRKIASIFSEIKKIVYDEFHVTKGSPAIADQVLNDMRVGRKYNIVICLSSQRDEDFNEAMLEMATTTILMSRGAADKQIKQFNLNQDSAQYLRRLNGPTRDGAPMLFLCKTTEGEFAQFIYLPLPSILVWAWSTTKEDMVLRDYTFSKLHDYPKTVSILSKIIPYGCKSLVHDMVRTSGAVLTGDEDAPLEIYENIFSEKIKPELLKMAMAA
ncbi:hypothetical protein ACTG16_21460 [Aeromonas sp. 23P]|uniref:hypothetical protein n=1 Tax=Aeromonas sp. 23P TaxID=3452716 RepID=UPI003F799B0E|nr:ATP-binding protein [Aeromonas veronii]